MCDDELPVYVSATAAESLVRLGFGEDKNEVFSKAQSQGIPVNNVENCS
jgi:hypothetical protein